jgi:hypothetical protein
MAGRVFGHGLGEWQAWLYRMQVNGRDPRPLSPVWPSLVPDSSPPIFMAAPCLAMPPNIQSKSLPHVRTGGADLV